MHRSSECAAGREREEAPFYAGSAGHRHPRRLHDHTTPRRSSAAIIAKPVPCCATSPRISRVAGHKDVKDRVIAYKIAAHAPVGALRAPRSATTLKARRVSRFRWNDQFA